MKIDYDALARDKSDDALVAMVERQHRDFAPEALAAARAELDSREVSYAEPKKRRRRGCPTE